MNSNMKDRQEGVEVALFAVEEEVLVEVGEVVVHLILLLNVTKTMLSNF